MTGFLLGLSEVFMQPSHNTGIIIIGAGEAGTRAALTLRQKHYAAPLTLINEEAGLPYERPPLSKSALTNIQVPSPVFIADAATLAAQNIHYLQGVAVTELNRAAHTVILQNGTQLEYTQLLLATGASPRPLALPHADQHHIHYLRTYADAMALRSQLAAGMRLLVIGGGFIGLEVAASAVEKGCLVTVVEMAPRILGRAVPADLAALVAARHRAAGVHLIEAAGLSALQPQATGYVVTLADGRRVECDRLVVGIGALPQTRLAELAGLTIDNGIRVDERLATSDPAIFAAGDCCSFPHPCFDGRRLRLEAWRNAQDQGRHVAGSMLGDTAPFSAIPWFWSDQYEDTLQITGLPDEGDQTITRNTHGTKFLFHLKSGRLVGASAFGPLASVARDIRLAELLIEAKAYPNIEALANPDVKLKSLLAARVDA